MEFNFNRDDLVAAIQQIDKNPDLIKGRQSNTYDLHFEGKKYPPILILSEANKLKGGKELLLSDFGNSTAKAFKILENNGFEVIRKSGDDLTQLLKAFQTQYPKDKEGQFSKNLASYQILVNDIPSYIRDRFDLGKEYKVTGSVGAGNFARYPWVAIFHRKITSQATKGYYIGMLFTDDLQEMYLTLNQGSTTQSQSEKDRNERHVFGTIDNIDGFTKGQLPSKSLTKIYPASSTSNGTAYEKTNLFYRKYTINNMNIDDLEKHLEKLIEAYTRCAELDNSQQTNTPEMKDSVPYKSEKFNIQEFQRALLDSNLSYSEELIVRFVASLMAKRFVLLSGLAGSGKTKIAQSFAKWISEDDSQYAIVPVGADWINREPLLGYPDGLDQKNYVMPDNGVLDLMLGAKKNSRSPYFLILDEMNLSHVERYFADFLSVMESGESISLYSGRERKSNGATIPREIKWPANLFIIGTVNIDETTYMFSPKVLDRANVIEFRLDEQSIEDFFENRTSVTNPVDAKGVTMAEDFLRLSLEKETFLSTDVKNEILAFFTSLKTVGAEFGYRTITETLILLKKLKEIDETIDTEKVFDIAIMQKFLPKLHGSRSKIARVLEELMKLCLVDELDVASLLDQHYSPECKYPISFEKLRRMYKNAIDNGFASYAEA